MELHTHASRHLYTRDGFYVGQPSHLSFILIWGKGAWVSVSFQSSWLKMNKVRKIKEKYRNNSSDFVRTSCGIASAEWTLQVDNSLSLVLWMGKLRLRVVNQLVQSHTASEGYCFSLSLLDRHQQDASVSATLWAIWCCSNPSLVRKCHLCMSNKGPSKGQGPSPLCVICQLLAQGLAQSSSLVNVEWGRKGERGEEVKPPVAVRSWAINELFPF